MSNDGDQRHLDVRVVDVSGLTGLTGGGGGGGGGTVVVGFPVGAVDGTITPVDGTPATVVVDGTSIDLSVGAELCARRGFTAKAGEALMSDHGPVPLVLVGCGETTSPTPETLRKVAAVLVRKAGRHATAVLVVPGSSGGSGPGPRRAGQAMAEGAVLAAYRFVTHKTDSTDSSAAALVIAAPPAEVAELSEGVRRGQAVAEAVYFARDLVNEPPSTMTPKMLADAAARHLAGRGRVQLEVWDEGRIAQERLGGLAGVARGSNEPPRLLRATYDPGDDAKGGRVPHVVLVGKGITFDSGGLSLKTAEGMMTMKTDMSGAAAVLATVGACEALGVAVRVTAIAPVTENMPGGRAIKPGDVLTVRDGQTIEVLNTDAEGRLVLSDGLTLARELEPDAIVDVATLTGACVVALGGSMAGLFTNDDDLGADVLRAAALADEKVWRLPLVEEYRSHIDSEVADMKNIGKAGQAGAIAAALLLEKFVGDIPWAHLDIAGPARSEEDNGILSKGGTGFAVRTLLELVQILSEPGRT